MGIVMVRSSLVPRPLSEKSRRGLATRTTPRVHAHCTVRANQVAEFSYVMLIKNVIFFFDPSKLVTSLSTSIDHGDIRKQCMPHPHSYHWLTMPSVVD